jgi:hypothetical protein
LVGAGNSGVLHRERDVIVAAPLGSDEIDSGDLRRHSLIGDGFRCECAAVTSIDRTEAFD